MHEELKRSSGAVQVATDRSFGFVFAGFFTIVSGVLWWKESANWPWTLVLAAVFLLVALTTPGLLAPLNRLWMKFGALLHRVVSPLVMGLIFFLTVTPMAMFLRLRKTDLLRLKFDPQAKTYWIERSPPGPDPKTMPNVY